MKEVEMFIANVGGPWMPNLTTKQSAKLGQVLTVVNSMSEVVSTTTTVPTQSRKKKGNQGEKDGVPPILLPSSSKQKSRKRKFRKFKKKSKKQQTLLDINPSTVQGAGPCHDKYHFENMNLDSERAKTPIPSLLSPTEVRLATLKVILLQAKGRDKSNNPESKPLPKLAISESLSARLKVDLLEEISRKRVASPELSVPAADDYWGILNYEKRSEKINMELVDSFLCEDSRS
jgi:hypothetical protein